ncbi:MAG: hypothetical protein PHI97_11895 [Desulfobulbus sp.]|nr:hypothetical protein [Desulfobulbus sp.]
MKTATTTYQRLTAGISLFLAALQLCPASPAFAKDTDIYAINTKQNCYVLMDSSGSMNFGVYQHTIDYGAMFDYLFTLNDSGSYNDYIYDTINNSATFYKNHEERHKIFLWKGEIGATIATINNEKVAFSGDAADPDYLWHSDDLVDTHTLIDDNGNLSDDGTGNRRITVDSSGYILFDGKQLPLGLNIKEHDTATLYDGTSVDNGFAGLLNAPGYYFSGYEGVGTTLDPVETGDKDVYFFITGNWANMQAMYNLHYTTFNPTPQGASKGDAAWPFEKFPLSSTLSWSQLSYSLDYPNGSGNYADRVKETDTAQTIVSAGAQQLQIHFSFFDVEGDSNQSKFQYDSVTVYDASGNKVAQYDNDNKPTNGDGWTPTITGDTAVIKLQSDNNVTGQGYTIDKIRVNYDATSGGSYLMQSRLDVAKDAMTYVVDKFRGKMNWGFASFKNGDGAQVLQALNPTETDDANRAAIVQQIENVIAEGGTPLMEALQDVWDDGYFGRKNVLEKLLCRKNYIISMTDGFPSLDTDNQRISGKTFSDEDGDGWTSDPYQPPTNPNFYDDVAHWIYTHSWMDKTEVADPANSYVNVTTHHIAFGAKQPLLENAAKESGGQYIIAYNKEQLVSAFYSLALLMSEAVSFTAPVVSVDAVNKIQSGDDLYMGLFLPMDSTYWTGNVKKFKMGDGTTDRPNLFMVYDGKNNEAIDSSGNFLDNTAAIWGDDLDPNDTDSYGAADIKEDGAGEVLLEDVQGYFSAGTFWSRPIYTWTDSDSDGNKEMVKFDRTHITKDMLGVADDATRDKLINFIHGYTYNADATTGAPLAVREWIMGPIIHSRPVVVDYFDTSKTSLPLQKRLIAVGSNDGMLHVLDDTNGREVFAFIPEDILTKLQFVQANNMYDTVDGLVTLYRRDKNPKYLFFGERRGGKYFWNLNIADQDPTKWTVQWSYTNAEIAQSWSEVKVASLPTGITTNGERSYTDVAIFTGGYDPDEDNFPEPFNDEDSNGTPYKSDSTIDSKEWSKNTAGQDINNNGVYDAYNPGNNLYGRGVFVVDIDNPSSAKYVNGDSSKDQLLPFSAMYGATATTSGFQQTLPTMHYCFPAAPSVLTDTDSYRYVSGTDVKADYEENVLRSFYSVDVYANLFKTYFTFDVTNSSTTSTPHWSVDKAGWTVKKIFSANPGSSSGSGWIGGTDTGDVGRKAFYPPAISFGGSKGYFQANNYSFTDTTFEHTDTMASLFFGTGDREHPKYTMIRNRFYAVYDDSSVSATLNPTSSTPTPIQVSSAPYTEKNLLNLTCDELGRDTVINSCYLGLLGGLCNGGTAAEISSTMKSYLRSVLKDDAIYDDPAQLENGATKENDAKGWYIVLADQGKTSVCSHVTYPTTIDASSSTAHDYHEGEQVLSQAILYYGTLYFTTYQASISDPCNPQGNGFSYALNYLDGSATYDLNSATNTDTIDVTDRYKKFTGIYGIPSGFTIVLRDGRAAAMASMGGAIIGPGPDINNPYEIDTPGLGLELYYWRDSNSQQKN